MDNNEQKVGGECIFSHGVICFGGRCRLCGWNPVVERRRKHRLRVQEQNGTLVKKEV